MQTCGRLIQTYLIAAGLQQKLFNQISGAIGGSVSHEFMVITDTDAGENDVFYCDDCDYAANSNHAVSKLPQTIVEGNFEKTEIVDTPNTHSIEELCELFKYSCNNNF